MSVANANNLPTRQDTFQNVPPPFFFQILLFMARSTKPTLCSVVGIMGNVVQRSQDRGLTSVKWHIIGKNTESQFLNTNLILNSFLFYVCMYSTFSC